MDQVTTGNRAGRREWLGLAVLALPLLLVSMDVSVLYFAVPFIGRALHPSSTQQLWILDMYGFVLAGLLITMGALGDRIGRRRLLLIGAVAFGGASVLAAYATGAAMLIGARALLGLGGATLMPSTLGLLRAMFRDDRQRARVLTAWTGAMTAGIGLGPVVSGILLEHFWWGSIFLVNLPAMALLLVLGPVLLPESRTPAERRTHGFDLLGSLLSLGAVLPVVYGVKELAGNGFEPLPAVGIVLGLAVGAVFVRRQLVHPGALLDMSLFRRRAFSAPLLVNLLAMVAMVGISVFTTQYLESVLGLSPLAGALWSLAPTVVVGGCAPLAAVLAARFHAASVIALGFLVAAAGFAAMTLAQVHSGVWVILIGAGLEAGGLVMVMSLITGMVLGAAPEERAGSAAAVLESATEFGGALGMALLGALGTAVYRSGVLGALPAGLAPAARTAAEQTMGGAQAVAAGLPGRVGDEVLAAARQAFVQGLHAAAIGGAVLMVAAAALAVLLLRRGAAPTRLSVPAAAPRAPESAHRATVGG